MRMNDPKVTPNVSALHIALQGVRNSAAEEVLIERAIGRAFIAKLSGKSGDLSSAYQSLGGDDPVTSAMFEGIDPVFAKLDATPAATQARKVANTEGVQASKSATVSKDNPVFSISHTALNTLAALGGEKFKEKFNIS
jgi:hypothetical protein